MAARHMHQAVLLSPAMLQLTAPLAAPAGARRPQQPCPSYQPRPANSATSGSMAAPRKRPAGSLHKAGSKEMSPAASQQDGHVGVMPPPARPGRGPSPQEGAWAANGAAGNDAGDPQPAAGLHEVVIVRNELSCRSEARTLRSSFLLLSEIQTLQRSKGC